MRILRALVSVVAVFLAGFAIAQSPESDAEPSTPIAVGESAPSDVEIRQRLENLLTEIDGFATVSLRVSQGVVPLNGDVIDIAARDELAELVGRTEGVVRVDNEVQVSGSLEERLAPAADRSVERAGKHPGKRSDFSGRARRVSDCGAGWLALDDTTSHLDLAGAQCVHR